jgi:glycosyltransferase involved in cell wall biosynthesis
MSKPRVLLVMHELSRTGAPIVALRVFDALRDELDIRVVARTGGPLEESFRERFPLVVLRPTVPAGAAIGRIRAAWYQGFDGKWRPDAVYVNGAPALPTLTRLKAVTRRRPPVIAHVHEGPVYLAGVEREFPGFIGTLPDRYIAVSAFVRDGLVSDFGVDPRSVSVIPPPVGDEWLASPILATGPSADRPLVIGGTGVPSWTKGVELWLLTAEELVKRSPGRFRFLWVGTRDDEASRQAMAMAWKLGIAQDVEFIAQTTDPRPYYERMDVFLLSSWEDSSPLVVLEAMAMGKAVVCIAGAGGAAEEVGDTGLVVGRFAPTAIADGIESLVPDGIARLGVAARARVAESYRLGPIAECVRAEIEQAAPGRSRRS